MRLPFTVCGGRIALLLSVLLLAAQTTGGSQVSALVPPLVNFSGVLSDADGKPLTWPHWRDVRSVRRASRRSASVGGDAKHTAEQERPLFGDAGIEHQPGLAGQSVLLRSGKVAGSAAARTRRTSPSHAAKRAVCLESRRRADAGRHASFSLRGGAEVLDGLRCNAGQRFGQCGGGLCRAGQFSVHQRRRQDRLRAAMVDS